jgi:hypothetical protein
VHLLRVQQSSSYTGDYGRYDFLTINPSNAYVVSQRGFQSHLSTQFYRIGVGLQVAVNFMDTHMETLEMYESIAYRLLTQEESARIAELSVGLPNCVFNCVYVLIQGLSAEDVQKHKWKAVEESEDMNWVAVVGYQDQFKETQHNGVLELAMIHCSNALSKSGPD